MWSVKWGVLSREFKAGCQVWSVECKVRCGSLSCFGENHRKYHEKLSQEPEGGDATSGAPGTGSASSGNPTGTEQTGARAAGSSGQDAQGPWESEGSHAGPCEKTPHCEGFEERHRGLPAEKLLQYKFLSLRHHGTELIW